MKTFTCQAGDRLDKIVFENYGTLEVFSQVVEANPQIGIKTTFEDGEVIILPTVELAAATKTEVKTLW